MKEIVKECIEKSICAKNKLLNDDIIIELISTVSQEIIQCYKNGNKVCICGNGGSAADAQHFAAELVGRFLLERKALPAIAFTTDSSILTSIGNDYGYDNVFERQVEGLVKKGDIFVVISTSGNSNNLLKALDKANSMGAVTVGLLGKNGGKCKEKCKYPLIVDWENTPNIQECHITIIHTICKIVEEAMYEE